jgi:predicted nucleic acid-binding protein
MTALDTNVIVASMVSSLGNHKEVLTGLERIADELCTTPTNIGEVMRILTHPKVFSSPLKVERVAATLANFIDVYNVRILDEDPNWWKGLDLVTNEIPGLKGNEILNAQIALCLKSHGVKRIFTRDADFKKFSFLQVVG